jgi:hypothetical protein
MRGVRSLEHYITLYEAPRSRLLPAKRAMIPSNVHKSNYGCTSARVNIAK